MATEAQERRRENEKLSRYRVQREAGEQDSREILRKTKV